MENTKKSNSKKLSPYIIAMKVDLKTEYYRVSEKMFQQIKNKLAPYRSIAPRPKKVKCIETGEIFESANNAKCWLIRTGITDNPSADGGIKKVCKGNQTSSYGYHWQFIEQ